MSISNLEIEAIVKKIVSEMGSDASAPTSPAKTGYEIPVGISNRHIHLTEEHVEILWSVPSIIFSGVFGTIVKSTFLIKSSG